MHNDGTFAIQPTQNQTIFHGRAEQGVAEQLREIARKTEAEQEARRTAPLSAEQEAVRQKNLDNLCRAEAEKNAPFKSDTRSDASRITCPKCGEQVLASQGVHFIGTVTYDAHGLATDTRRTCVSDVRKAIASGRNPNRLLEQCLVTRAELEAIGLTVD
jgi:hypothetical protein